MWFDTWHDLTRILLVGTSSYALLVVLLRVTGKRTLAKLNAFDFVVTIALGSAMATIILDSRTSLSDGLLALALLVGLQLVVAATTARIPWARGVVTARPTVLLLHGEPRPGALRSERVGIDELRQAVRRTGVGTLASVAAVVLETDGTLSVVPEAQAGDLSVLPEEGQAS